MYADHHDHEIATDIEPGYCHTCSESFYTPAKPVMTSVEKIKARLKRGFNPAPDTSEALRSFADAKLDMAQTIKLQGGKVNPEYDINERIPF